MAKTMVSRVQESKMATNIYLTEEVALHLAGKIIMALEQKKGVRIVIRNKDTRPDIGAYAYKVKE